MPALPRILASSAILASIVLLVAAAPPPQRSRTGMVASDHEIASQAGAEILAMGGNAADAAVATALACGVVQPAGSGLGGGGFAIVVGAGEPWALDFREVAPAAAHREMYLDANGEVIAGLSNTGGLAVAVPAEGRGLATLHARYGRLPLDTVATPAIRLAKKGYPLGEHLYSALESHPEMAGRLFGLDEVPEPGTLLTRPRLAKTIKAWAKSGGEALNVGPIAEDLAAAAQAAGGVLTVEDLAAYRPIERAPLQGEYRGHAVISMPPPSSGGAALLQMLGALEAWELGSLGHNSSAHLHLLAEVMQHAFADRAERMGDPGFTEVPVEEMLSIERIEAVRAAFDPDRTLERGAYGIGGAIPDDDGTQHISVLDADGMAVALTTTINTAFGSEVVATASGVVLNDQMDDFVSKPGVPNAYGLIGREANGIEPGKRPLSSMTPTVVLDPRGEVLLVAGASGGPMIITSTLQSISNVIDFGLDAEEAVSAPRVHHQWVPELLFFDVGYPADLHEAMEARGHAIREMAFGSSSQVVHRDGEWLFGAADPRKAGEAAGASE